METIVFIISILLLLHFFILWYQPIIKLWPRNRNKRTKIILGILPVIFPILFIFMQFFTAFSGKTGNLYNIIFYIILGYAWILTGFILTTLCFDLHWTDDVLHLNNKAVLPVIIGEFFAIVFIYTGANAGNTSGWQGRSGISPAGTASSAHPGSAGPAGKLYSPDKLSGSGKPPDTNCPHCCRGKPAARKLPNHGPK